MTAPNHVAGGIVFTGLFASLFTINIFANPFYIIITILSCLIPDIDHTKSLIGKLFYPIAKWLSINYGHRTITHSLIFITGITIISVFIEKIFGNNLEISLIIFFGILSHLILDMITLQGIPLFYPFKKNPCVLPANPDLRIRSGDLKSEGIAFFIFAVLTIFMQDLFYQGFWSKLNNQFGDFKHIQKEFKENKNQLILAYNYNIYQNQFKGKGTLINIDNDNLYILQNDKLNTITNNSEGLKINLLKTTKTNKKTILKNYEINNISIDSLNKILKNQFIQEIAINSNFPINLNNQVITNKKTIKLKNQFNIQINTTFNDSLVIDKKNKINELKIQITSEKEKLINSNKKYYQYKNQLVAEKIKLNQTNNLYELNEIKNNIIFLENFLEKNNLIENLTINQLETNLIEIKNKEITKINLTGIIKTLE